MNRFFTKKYVLVLLALLYSLSSVGDDKFELSKYRFLLGNHEEIKNIKNYAEKGHAEAAYYMGEAYFWGKGVEVNMNLSKEWYLKSAEACWPDSLYVIAICLMDGSFGCKKNTTKAIKYFKKAAEQGHKNSIDALREFRGQSKIKIGIPGTVYL